MRMRIFILALLTALCAAGAVRAQAPVQNQNQMVVPPPAQPPVATPAGNSRN